MRTCARAWAVGLATLLAGLGLASGLSADNNRDRTISFFTVNKKETLTVQYMKDGKRIPEAMEKINWILRDWRRDEKTTMDPNLIDLLWEMHAELGSKEPIHVISAYRSRNTNDMLRRTVGGQASESRHILGKAMDVMFPDVPLKRLRYSALLRERGGVGYYPTSGIPFIHVDTDRVRAWPRATRQELALLFPNGRTQHVAADGGMITPGDVRLAMANKDLAAEMAEFHELRRQPKPPVQLASFSPPALPQLLAPPKPVERPMALGTRASEDDRARLAALAAAPEPPRLLAAPQRVERPAPAKPAALPAWETSEPRAEGARPARTAANAPPQRPAPVPGTGVVLPRSPVFVAQPSFDDEHFEELSFNMFPVGPLLTATASRDDPSLVRLVHPFAQELKGEEMSIASFIEGEAEAARGLSALPNRQVAAARAR